MPKRRADQALVELGLAESRTRAQALILAGKVWSGGARVAKAGDLLAEGAALEVRGQDHPWASRGGLKLDHALQHFGFSPAGLVCLDVGASTGGFTSVLLHYGAVRVYAVDVGHGQFAWAASPGPAGGRARAGERPLFGPRAGARAGGGPGVRCELHRACHGAAGAARPVRAGGLGGRTDQTAIRGRPRQVGKGGVVRDPAVHRAVVARIKEWWSALPGWRVEGVAESPITGPEGNREFLIAAKRGA